MTNAEHNAQNAAVAAQLAGIRARMGMPRVEENFDGPVLGTGGVSVRDGLIGASPVKRVDATPQGVRTQFTGCEMGVAATWWIYAERIA